MYRLLALDIDGTLVNSRDELTPRTRAALRRASEAGVLVVLATGRRYSRALPLVEMLGLDAPLVTASGALIKRPSDHSTLYRAEFGRELLCRLLAVVDRSGYDAVLYGDTFHHGFDFFCPRIDVEQTELAEFFALNPDCHTSGRTMMSRSAGRHLRRLCDRLARSRCCELHDALQRELPGQLYTHVLRSPRYRGYMCEIAPARGDQMGRHLSAGRRVGDSARRNLRRGRRRQRRADDRRRRAGRRHGQRRRRTQGRRRPHRPRPRRRGVGQVVEWMLEEK